ncbi:hypothetical protein [Microbacterium sp. SS28]|uniref:hypothetical protein n=1 Tax=Microbacterium sp. SS28 TaxID=2919948 RepID=UPI001FAB2E99|nr:hypothetical protein [Microbacterium sp. SS28]
MTHTSASAQRRHFDEQQDAKHPAARQLRQADEEGRPAHKPSHKGYVPVWSYQVPADRHE